jgi:Na+/proline symporter
MVTGTLVTIFWKLFLTDPTGIYELIPAFICSSLAIIVCGLVSTDAKKRKIENGECKNQVS